MQDQDPTGTSGRTPEAALAHRILSGAAVRQRAGMMLALAEEGLLPELLLDRSRLSVVADRVIAVTRESYPDLQVPLHARWRHFGVGGIDRWAELAAARGWTDPRAAARAAADLAVVSVLLDAGAGAAWRYREGATGLHFARSEGLAVASVAMFASGLFSGVPADPLRADAAVLAALADEELARGLQLRPGNAMPGFEGRAALVRRLGQVVGTQPAIFGLEDEPRPGGIIDTLVARSVDGRLEAASILEVVLEGLGPIWPSRLELGGYALGDCWRHPLIVTRDATTGLVPLHKLSQWLSYSLIEPLGLAGIEVVEIDGLTGLAEYRNGGLFLDTGVLTLADPADREREHAVGSSLVVAWRALTVALLDETAELVRARLGRDAASLPLGAVLEGGTWAAGRRIAAELRPGGGPPLKIDSDGTVF